MLFIILKANFCLVITVKESYRNQDLLLFLSVLLVSECSKQISNVFHFLNA